MTEATTGPTPTTLPADSPRIYAEPADGGHTPAYVELLGKVARLVSGDQTGKPGSSVSVDEGSFMLDARNGTLPNEASTSIRGDADGLHFDLSTPYAIDHPGIHLHGRLDEWVDVEPVNEWAAPIPVQAKLLLTGEIAIRGRITAATAGKTGVFGVLPARFHPATAETFVLNSGTGAARVQIGSDGRMAVLGYLTGGSATSGVNLNGIRVLTS